MKKLIIKIVLPAILLSTGVGCKKYLNINSDPDTTQEPSNSSVFPAMLAGIPRGVQYDARYISKYIQNWLTAANGNADMYDRQGGIITTNDVTGDIWRQTYFGLGGNLEYIIRNGIKKGEYDYTGAALALKALMFQMCTDYHGDIIYSEAFMEGKYYFKYDTQDVVYRGVDSLCRDAINYFNMAASGNNKLATGDFVYNGDYSKWKKLVYTILAKNFHRYTNKSTYSADSVLKYCDLAMSSINDDFVIPFDASKNDDSNFWGPYRNNLASYKQSNFIVKLLDGTTLSGNALWENRDPRMKHMLSASQDTTNGNGGFRGVDPGIGDPYSATTTGANALKRVAAVWGDSIYANPSAAVFTPGAGKYLFKDKVVMPVDTYSEVQFIKAEAAYRKGDKATAFTAYQAGINAHFDFINRATWPRGDLTIYNGSPITAAQRAAYLAGNNVKKTAATLTMTDIMLQKYIALWGWGWVETWVDLRRFHYLDIDPATTQQVYKNFAYPVPFYATNNNLPVQRVRPRYNSEYVWNLDELKRIGADKSDYHTIECWFSKP